MSRILTLLLLYKFEYFVGRYISIEMLIEESKNSYYEELQNSSENWHTGENDELPFMKYMLGIIMKAYEECDNRFRLIGKGKLTSPERVFSVIQKSLEPLSKKDIIILSARSGPCFKAKTIEPAKYKTAAANAVKISAENIRILFSFLFIGFSGNFSDTARNCKHNKSGNNPA